MDTKIKEKLLNGDVIINTKVIGYYPLSNCVRRRKKFEHEIENFGNLINEIIGREIFIKTSIEYSSISYELKKNSISENEALMLELNNIKIGSCILNNN